MHAAWVAELTFELLGKLPKKAMITGFDIGCGDGLTTVALIEASPQIKVISVMPEEAVPLVYELLNGYAEQERCFPAPIDSVELSESTI